MGLESKNKVTLTTCATAVIQGRSGVLKSVYTTGIGAGTVQIYNHCTTCMLACDGCLITTIDTTTLGTNMPYLNNRFEKGLAVIPSACAGTITLVYE